MKETITSLMALKRRKSVKEKNLGGVEEDEFAGRKKW